MEEARLQGAAAQGRGERDPPAPLTLIVDDARLGAAVARELSAAERALERRGLRYVIARSTAAGDAEASARAVLEAGARFLVAVGDDVTVNAVVNGMIRDDAPVADDAVLGVLPAGVECDFAKTFGLPLEVERLAEHLTGERVYPIDVAKATFIGHDGRETSRYFANISQIGLGARITARASRLPTGLGRARYFSAFWLSLASYRRPEVEVKTGSRDFRGRATNVVVGNCQFARGMRISPRSFPGDGLLEVLVYAGPKSDAFTMLPKMWDGEQVPDENIVEYRAKRAEVDADRPLEVEVDGLYVGTTPVRVELVPRAIRVKI